MPSVYTVRAFPLASNLGERLLMGQLEEFYLSILELEGIVVWCLMP